MQTNLASKVRVTRQSFQMDSHADDSDKSAVSDALIGGAADRQNDDDGMAVLMDDDWDFGQQPSPASWSLGDLNSNSKKIRTFLL